MDSYGEKVLHDLAMGGMDKAKDTMLTSVQDYSNKIMNGMNGIPHPDTVFFIAAVKMINRTLGVVFEEESKLAEGLVNSLSVDAILVSMNPDGTDKHLFHVKDEPKR